MTFEGQTVFITGAAVGIGRATAIRFAQYGANVVLADMNLEKLEEVKKELKQYTDHVLVYACDVSDEERVHDVIQSASEIYGNIDILVNNAGVWRSFVPFEDITSELWRKMIDINLMGTVYCTKEVLKDMKEKRFGRIINVASVAGVYGNARMAHYSATKGAMISMTKALAKEVAEYGITVNCISPGSVSSSENPDPDFYQESELCFMGRTGTNMENADLICFLASQQAAYISGQNIQIDGVRKKL